MVPLCVFVSLTLAAAPRCVADTLILAVSHSAYLGDRERLLAMLRPGGVFVDLKSAFAPSEIRLDVSYWSL